MCCVTTTITTSRNVTRPTSTRNASPPSALPVCRTGPYQEDHPHADRDAACELLGAVALRSLCLRAGHHRDPRGRELPSPGSLSAMTLNREFAGGTDQHCTKVLPIESILQYRFATPKPLQTRQTMARCVTARLCNPLSPRASLCRIGPRRQGFASPLRALDGLRADPIDALFTKEKRGGLRV